MQFPFNIIIILFNLVPAGFFLYKTMGSAIRQVKLVLEQSPEKKLELPGSEQFVMLLAMGAGTIMIPFMNKKSIAGEQAYFLAQDHMLTIFILALVAFGSYLSVRYSKLGMGPFLLAFAPLGVLTGIVLYGVLLVHFAAYFLMTAVIWILSLAQPQFLFAGIVILSLPAAIVFMVASFIEAARYNYHVLKPYYQSGFLKALADLYEHSVKGYFSITLLWFAFIQLIQSFLTLFGQKPDSHIKAFSEACHRFMLGSGDCYTMSTTHYLCTIAVNGNRRLVKPLRPGMRKGQWILVNRQLMVCNAFEEWLAEKAPALQKWLRKRYDALEVPVNALSRYKWLANLLYIGSKPMEWLFVLTLYLFDGKPERRIQKQYLPNFEPSSCDNQIAQDFPNNPLLNQNPPVSKKSVFYPGKQSSSKRSPT